MAVLGHRAHALGVREALGEARGAMAVREGLYAVTVEQDLDRGLARLGRQQFEAVLLDLGLCKPGGRDALEAVGAAAPDAAILVLATDDDEGRALEAIRRGAQECLTAGQLQGSLLRRTIRLALERKRAERQQARHTRQIEAASEEIKQRVEQLERLNRELDDFAYVVSHDLKEPLCGIRAYCELLEEEYRDRIDGDGQQRLASLQVMCQRMADSIDSLLTYCRVGRIPSTSADVDLNTIVEEVVQSLEETIRRCSASVRVAGRLPVVAGDPTLIRMVLTNLVGNAVKFNDGVRPSVEIGSREGRPPVIHVRDNGIGIPPEHHEAVFDIFRRLHARREYEGTGAGLTIVRKIVRAHGGRVWLESAPGHGSTFYFTLAAGKPPVVAQPPHWGSRTGAPRTAVAISAISATIP